MNTIGGWLTASLVEDIQHAVTSGIEVASAVASFKRATLTGIMEYGCLRFALPELIPKLPRTLASSPLGNALSEVQSELGIAVPGPGRRPLNRIDAQSVEFCTVHGEEQFQNKEWQHFEIRFNRSAQGVGFQKKTAYGLQGALHEMVENAVIHAGAPIPILVGYHVEKGMARFCAADVGVGVLASLRTCPDYQRLRLHKDAVRAALQDGTSRFGRNTRGLGFRSVFKALVANWGYLRFRSGNGCITMDGRDLDADRGQESFPPYLPGFQVTVCCHMGEEYASGFLA